MFPAVFYLKVDVPIIGGTIRQGFVAIIICLLFVELMTIAFTAKYFTRGRPVPPSAEETIVIIGIILTLTFGYLAFRSVKQLYALWRMSTRKSGKA